MADKNQYYCPRCLDSSPQISDNEQPICLYCKTDMIIIPNVHTFSDGIDFANNPDHKKDPRFSQEAYEKRINRKPVQMYSAPNGGARCISCGSSNVRKISVASKVGSVALWGIFAAGRTSKRYHCNKCGTEW